MAKPKVLYIAYWGAAEPLGQSLILPAVLRLADRAAELTLVTFEKPADLRRKEEIRRIRALLSGNGVKWMPLSYHKRPKVPATAFDIARGLARPMLSRLTTRFDIVHARTFVGGVMGLMLAPALQAKLIYHNEGFYPDEQVDGGVWALNSRPHRLAKSLERRMYSRADAIIALSNRAKHEIERLPGVERKQTPVIVVPSCVDLSHFRFNPTERARGDDVLRFVYIGSVGGRYTLDRIGRFAAVASTRHKVHLKVITRTSAELVRSILGAAGLPNEAWSLDSADYADMPQRLKGNDAGLFFLTEGISEHGCSPTKIGEYWAVGLPVITTPNVSDTDEIIRRERVGVVVHGHDDGAYLRAVQEMRTLLVEDELSSRCRRAAEAHYSLEAACERQLALYRALAQPDSCKGRELYLSEYSAPEISAENKR